LNQKEFHKLLQKRLAEISVSAPSLRNQGNPGLISSSRLFCSRIPLKEFNVSSEKQYNKILDKFTNKLMKEFPHDCRNNWGAARKTLNLFLREVMYNTDLSRQFKLKVIQFLEIPLDSYTAVNLYKHAKGNNLPRWISIKSLTKEISGEYQEVANQIALELKIPRIHLDLLYWRKK